MKKQLIYLLFALGFGACSQTSTNTPQGIRGRVFHAHLSGDRLLLYAVQTVDDIVLGSGNDTWESIEYEEAYFAAIQLKDSSARPLYQVPTSCSQQTCGKHYTDKLIAVGDAYAALNCSCKGNFSIIDLQTGKEAMDTEKAIARYAELSSGIAEWKDGQAGTAVLITGNDGRKFNLSLHDLRLSTYQSSKTDCILWEAYKTVEGATMQGQNYYFDKNTDDHQSFLVVRSTQSGTSQSRLYRTGEAWLRPAFLAHPVICGKAVEQDGHLFVLHASKWNDALSKDMLTMIDAKGDRIFSKSLSSLGCKDIDDCWFFTQSGYLYIVTPKQLSIARLADGELLREIPHTSWKFE